MRSQIFEEIMRGELNNITEEERLQIMDKLNRYNENNKFYSKMFEMIMNEGHDVIIEQKNPERLYSSELFQAMMNGTLDNEEVQKGYIKIREIPAEEYDIE